MCENVFQKVLPNEQRNGTESIASLVRVDASKQEKDAKRIQFLCSCTNRGQLASGRGWCLGPVVWHEAPCCFIASLFNRHVQGNSALNWNPSDVSCVSHACSLTSHATKLCSQHFKRAFNIFDCLFYFPPPFCKSLFKKRRCSWEEKNDVSSGLLSVEQQNEAAVLVLKWI